MTPRRRRAKQPLDAWALEHGPYTPMGQVEGYGRVASGLRGQIGAKAHVVGMVIILLPLTFLALSMIFVLVQILLS